MIKHYWSILTLKNIELDPVTILSDLRKSGLNKSNIEVDSQ